MDAEERELYPILRTSIEDGVQALALADAATRSWREKRIVEL